MPAASVRIRQKRVRIVRHETRPQRRVHFQRSGNRFPSGDENRQTRLARMNVHGKMLAHSRVIVWVVASTALTLASNWDCCSA